jgi:hypothetical protein
MAKTVKPADLSRAIAQNLTLYHEEVNEKIDKAGAKTIKDLVALTKATAPKLTGNFRRSIASKLLKKSKNGSVYVWYVKAPNHRLTHLLAHGHEKVNGGRVPGDPFLKNAVDTVLPMYEEAVKEAVKHD